MNKVITILFAFFCYACSTVHIKSNKEISVSLHDKETYQNEINISLTKEFFLWGLIPQEHEINLDKELIRRGYDSLSDLTIVQKNRRSDVIWTLLTFGVYYPQTYEIKGKTL